MLSCGAVLYLSNELLTCIHGVASLILGMECKCRSLKLCNRNPSTKTFKKDRTPLNSLKKALTKEKESLNKNPKKKII